MHNQFRGSHDVLVEQKRVLVVEDERLFSAAITMALEDEGYLVSNALNGLEALRLVAKSRFDAVILDLQMPVMNGIDFVNAYRQQIADPAPIIVCSTQREDSILRQLGAAAVLSKPIEIDETLDIVARLTSGIPNLDHELHP